MTKEEINRIETEKELIRAISRFKIGNKRYLIMLKFWTRWNMVNKISKTFSPNPKSATKKKSTTKSLSRS